MQFNAAMAPHVPYPDRWHADFSERRSIGGRSPTKPTMQFHSPPRSGGQSRTRPPMEKPVELWPQNANELCVRNIQSGRKGGDGGIPPTPKHVPSSPVSPDWFSHESVRPDNQFEQSSRAYAAQIQTSPYVAVTRINTWSIARGQVHGTPALYHAWHLAGSATI